MFASRIFRLILITGIGMLAVDILGRMDGDSAVSVPALNAIGNFLLFALNPITPILWLIYVMYQVYGTRSVIKKYMVYIFIFFAAHMAIMIFNLFFGFYYSIDANNVYTRGDYFALSILWTVIPLFISFGLTIVNRHKIDTRKYNAFIFFPAAPLIGTVLSSLIYGYSIILPTLVVADLLVFISIQNDNLRMDYLTNTFNRRHLEDILRKKISESNRQFGGIMLDIDGYKQINDMYGHLIGDRALIDFARVLQKSVGINDIVARYGGDEFMIIVEVKNDAALRHTIEKLKADIDKYNTKNVYPFELTASIGGALYDGKEKKTMEQFINYLDQLMYQDKKNLPIKN